MAKIVATLTEWAHLMVVAEEAGFNISLLTLDDVPLLQKIDAQNKLVYGGNTPYFAPHDGICWRCREQIYNHITLEKASKELITGCPCCSATYCD